MHLARTLVFAAAVNDVASDERQHDDSHDDDSFAAAETATADRGRCRRGAHDAPTTSEFRAQVKTTVRSVFVGFLCGLENPSRWRSVVRFVKVASDSRPDEIRVAEKQVPRGMSDRSPHSRLSHIEGRGEVMPYVRAIVYDDIFCLAIH